MPDRQISLEARHDGPSTLLRRVPSGPVRTAAPPRQAAEENPLAPSLWRVAEYERGYCRVVSGSRVIAGTEAPPPPPLLLLKQGWTQTLLQSARLPLPVVPPRPPFHLPR